MTSLVSKTLWEVRTAGPKGLGVFALFPIPRGTRIFSEAPLLSLSPTQGAGTIYSSARLLSAPDRKHLMSLSTYVTRELSIIRWNQALFYTFRNLVSYLRSDEAWTRPRNHSIKEHVALLSIFRNNAFDIGSVRMGKGRRIGQAVFRGISRINHSCVPNSQANYHEGKGLFNVHATRDIGVGEELSISYLPELGAVRGKRVERLRDGYGFECGCVACDLGSKVGRDGEERRVEMQRRLERYAERVGQVEDLKETKGDEKMGELEMMVAFVVLLDGQGIAGRELASLHLEVTKLWQAKGNDAEALKSAERALETDEACLGVDHPTYQETRRIVENLRVARTTENGLVQ